MLFFISIFSINIVLLTNDQKEAIVIKMLKKGQFGIGETFEGHFRYRGN